MYAIIETGGKQVKVEQGQEVYVEKLDAADGETVTFDKVLFVGGDDTKVGAPYVDGASVTAKVDKHGRQKRSLFSNISRRRTTSVSKVIVNLIQKSSLIKSTRKVLTYDYS